MNLTVIGWIAAALLTPAAVYLLYLLQQQTRARGAAEQKNEDAEKTLDDIKRAADIRDALRRDAGFAARVRARFTR